MIASSHFLIVEDELLIAETISDFLEREGCGRITIVDSVEEAVECIEKQGVDFVLTDIALGKSKTGIDLGNLINTKYQIPFIYITSHADKAMIDKAKHTRPNAYIVKPFKKEDLLVAIELGLFNAQNLPVQNDDDELIVKDGRAMVRIYQSNILWLEADGNYSIIHLNDNRRVIRTSLSELELQLSPESFVRIHKSYIVNKKHVTQAKSGSLLIKERELPVGRTHQQNLTDIFQKR